MKSFVFGLIILTLSCSGNRKLMNSGYELIRFKEKTTHGNSFVEQDYVFEVPPNGVLSKEYGFPGDEFYAEYHITYSDSSILYISNNVWSGSRLNYKNRFERGITALRTKNAQDSLTIGGIQKNGNYWKERIINDIVVGYVNVSSKNKIDFEKSIQSVRQNK